MRVIANRQLIGEYGTVAQNQEFECPDDIVEALREKGMVRALPPRIEYQTKIIVPEAPEVSARQPFRDVLVSHTEQEKVVTRIYPVLPATDVPPGGTPDSRRRGGRQGSRSGR